MPRNQGRKEEIPQGDTLMPKKQGRKEERRRNRYDKEITAFVCAQ